MLTLSPTRLAVAAGGLALSLTAATGVASADPNLSPVIDTTCTYPQAVSALNAQNPAVGAQFNASSVAQSWLGSFLAAPPDQRQQMLQEAEGSPEFQPYMGAMTQAANTCGQY